jgi:hypothetical protein
MSGLLRRLTRRPATADENRSSATVSSEPAAPPAPAGGEPPVPVPGEDQPTHVIRETDAPASDPVTRDWAIGPTGWSGRGEKSEEAPPPVTTVPIAGQFPERPAETQPVRAHDLPAGVDPAELEQAPASARRGKLRRRLRYLRSVRELLLRDLGGFTYEVHRSGSRAETAAQLQQAKAERIAALDAEVLALEARLGEPHATTTLREAGIGGTCPVCGELHASDAHFCSHCGEPLDAKARAKREAAPAEEGHAATGLWAGLRRKPSEPERAADSPAAVTGEWLGSADQPTTFDRAARREDRAAEKADGTPHPEDGTEAKPGRGTRAQGGPAEKTAGADGPPVGEDARGAEGDQAVTFVDGRREQA